MESPRKVILFIACSADGIIAKPGDNLDFLNLVESPGEDYGYDELIQRIDTVIMGRKTFDWVVKAINELPHKGKKVYVITHQIKPPKEHCEFYNDSLHYLIRSLKQQKGKDIFCDGGAEIVNLLLKDRLIDEVIISYIPVLLGEGKRLFSGNFSEQKLKLLSSRTFLSGLVQVRYQVVHDAR